MPQAPIYFMQDWLELLGSSLHLASHHLLMVLLACWVPVCSCRPQPGVREWLDTLGRFNVPCALVSALDRSTVQVSSGHGIAAVAGMQLTCAATD